MINALPFFFGSPGSPIQGNGWTGGVGLDQTKTSGNPSENPFGKILRDQSAAFFPLKTLQFSDQSLDERRLPDLESPSVNPDLSPRVLTGQDLPVDVFREISLDPVEGPLSIDSQLNLYPVTVLESAGQGLTEPEGVIPRSAIPLAVLGENEGKAFDGGEIPQLQMRLSSGEGLQEGSLTPEVFSPEVFLPGGPGANAVQTPFTMNQPVLPLLKGYSSIQSPLVGYSLAGNSTSATITNSDGQALLRDAVKEHSQLRESSQGGPPTASAGELGKNAGKPLDQLSGTVQDTDLLLQRIPPLLARTSVEPLRPLVNQAFQPPLPFEETSAGIAAMVQPSQNRLKYVSGVSSILGDMSGHGKESSIPSDLLGESILSGTGDRSKDGVDATGKSVVGDPNGGQGVNNGMGGSTNSQPGFQQSSSSHSPGSGMRMVEERVPDLPTPALQRLQMDVQLSETNRIQIDVGVQQRQVYAGLLMDQSTLKNLAVQFVPQLEDQLAQVDMDLQEFSAEVRDQHGNREPESNSPWSGTQHGQMGTTTFQHAPGLLPNTVRRVEEQGLHLVA